MYMQSIQDLKKNLEMSSTLSASVSEKSIIKKKKKKKTLLLVRKSSFVYKLKVYEK